MKRMFILFAVISLLLSCSSPETDFFNKSTKYLNAKINKHPDKENFDFISIDTIVKLSSKDLEHEKRKPLYSKFQKIYDEFESYRDIDKKYGGEISSQTRFVRNKAKELSDSLESWMDRDYLLDSTDVSAYKVVISAEGTNLITGAKMKDIKLPVYFDKEMDVDESLNSNLYDNL